jgi:hypothetical protein
MRRGAASAVHRRRNRQVTAGSTRAAVHGNTVAASPVYRLLGKRARHDRVPPIETPLTARTRLPPARWRPHLVSELADVPRFCSAISARLSR